MDLVESKVLLGLSGGVDSATAALLLKEKGYQVIGYYFDVLGNRTQEMEDAQKLAAQLGIELILEDVSKDFYEIVIRNFIESYIDGETPNPCIVCNPNIKFKKLIETANKIGAKHIATGHYCCVNKDSITGAYHLGRSINQAKDQTYMLYRLPQDVLSRVIFPLGEFKSKDEIRQIARANQLLNSEKKDSQEICFIDPQDHYIHYIQRAGFSNKKGNFVDLDGNILGQHQGILNYTIGQRKGLGIAFGKPTFVVKIDAEKNEVVLGDNSDLFSKKVISQNNFFTYGKLEDYHNKKVFAKVRYSAPLAEARLIVDGEKLVANFDVPQRAITPGQSIVFYDEQNVLGGGFIIDF